MVSETATVGTLLVLQGGELAMTALTEGVVLSFFLFPSLSFLFLSSLLPFAPLGLLLERGCVVFARSHVPSVQCHCNSCICPFVRLAILV